MSESGDEILLAVCTGNVCRSPYVALSLGARLRRDGIKVQVDSAGTHALVGSGVAEEVVVALSREGVDASLRRARQLTIDDIDRAALIVALAREHRSVVTRALPRASAKVFTLRQLERLIDLDSLPQGPVDSPLATLAQHCAARRGLATPSAEEDDDVVDPWGRGNSVFTRSFEQMRPGVTTLHRALEILVVGPSAAPAAG